MMNIFLRLAFVCTLLASPCAYAELITFDFKDFGSEQTGNDLDGMSTGVSIVTGASFTVTMIAVATNNGTMSGDTFNLNSDEFGINAGDSGDTTDRFDDGAGVHELMLISFDVGGTLLSVDFELITGTGGPGEDLGYLSFSSGSYSNNFHGGNVDVSDLFTVNQSFSAGEIITLGHIDDSNGWALQQISVSVVPEPSSAALLMAGLIAMGYQARKRSRR